jgi:multidrug resistance efflux pump
MTRISWTGAIAVTMLVFAVGYTQWPTGPGQVALASVTDHGSPDLLEPRVRFVAPGLTEPRSKAIQLVSELPGVLSTIHVLAGDTVRAGQLLAELNNDLEIANVEIAQAALDRANAELERLQNGARPEETAAARARLDEAEAQLRFAELEFERVEQLHQGNAASERERLQAQNQLSLAKARREVARSRWQLSRTGARAEDIASAVAAVREAEARLSAARSVLRKTQLRSPIDGVVLYRYREPGEAVHNNHHAPVLSIGDCSALHVRVDVDEADIGSVSVGQPVYATAPAIGDERIAGRVVHVEPTLGRKNFRTQHATERLDTKIQEVVVRLDERADLPLGLQMAVWFLDAAPESKPAVARQ